MIEYIYTLTETKYKFLKGNHHMNSHKVKKQAVLDDATLNYVIIIMAFIVALIIFTAVYLTVGFITAENAPILDQSTKLPGQSSENATYPFRQNISLDISYDTENAESITNINAPNAVLIDVTDGKIVAGKSSGGEISPASMTKVMALIVVIENLQNENSLNDLVTVTEDHISHKKSDRKLSGELGNSAYPAGQYTVKTLLHHMILDSSGVAALALADYIAGSEANFVKLMNDKAAEMGLERTSFVYCDGSHALGHKSTCRDMAKIMAYAMKNTFCADVLTALSYTDTNGTIYNKPLVHTYYQQNSNHNEISPSNADIIAAKTGWTGDHADGWSGGCLVSYAEGDNGHKYVVVVAHVPGVNYSTAIATAVQDSVAICNNYIK